MVSNADLQHEKSNPFALLCRSGQKSSSGRPSMSDGHSTHRKSFYPASTPSKKSHEKDETASLDSKDSQKCSSKEEDALVLLQLSFTSTSLVFGIYYLLLPSISNAMIPCTSCEGHNSNICGTHCPSRPSARAEVGCLESV